MDVTAERSLADVGLELSNLSIAAQRELTYFLVRKSCVVP